MKQLISKLAQCNSLDKKRDGYEVKMCANCGHEEEMHYMERWCRRCRKTIVKIKRK